MFPGDWQVLEFQERVINVYISGVERGIINPGRVGLNT